MSDSAPALASEVAIVGAGPVGLTLALLLARRGRDVAIYERWPHRYPLPRAVAMSHESVRIYQSAGILPALQPLLDSGVGEQIAEFFDKHGEVLMRHVYPGADQSGHPTMSGFNQPDVEALLERLCDESPHVTINRGWNVEAIVDQGDRVELALASSESEGPAQTATARFAIGCDGANSGVRELAGLSVTDTGFRSSWMVVDIRPHAPRVWVPELGQSLDPARPITIAPAGPNRRRFELMMRPDEDPSTFDDPATIWPLIADWGVTRDNATMVRNAFYTFRGRWADRWRAGRVLLAGDAAHQMPPFMAQGLNSGVRDAAALAWRLDLVLRGVAGEELLDSYGTERLAHVRQVVERAVELGRLICITDPVAAARRDDMLRHLRDHPELAPKPPEWRLGPGVAMPGDPNAGYLGIQARVGAEGGPALLDDMIGGGRFVLLGDGVDAEACLNANARAIWEQLDGVAAQIGVNGGFADVDGTYAAWFATLGAQIVLVRPDFQVFGGVADPSLASGLVATLAAQLGLQA